METITPGTIVQDNLLQAKKNNHLVSLARLGRVRVGHGLSGPLHGRGGDPEGRSARMWRRSWGGWNPPSSWLPETGSQRASADVRWELPRTSL